VAQPVCGLDFFTQVQSSGVLFYQPGAGSTLTKSTISGNDLGVYYGSGAVTAPVIPEVALSRNTLSGNRALGLGLDQGALSSTRDTISGPGVVGIGILQYVGQSYGEHATATHDKITGQGTAIALESDAAGAGDNPGSLTINLSRFETGNANLITNNSPGGNFTISGTGNH
jgi:hypothetical protein